MTTTIVICGAGFAGLELATRISESGADAEVTLIDRSDTFFLGFSKLDVMLGEASPESARRRYADFDKPGVTVRQESIAAIDPAARRVTTDAGTYDADILVVALGADYAHDATPGFVEGGHEFYTMDGAARLHTALESFTGGTILLSVLGVPYKCPPAPYEAAFLIDTYLRERGVRDDVEMRFTTPLPAPIPVSPTASAAINERFGQTGIEATFERKVVSIDPAKQEAQTADGETIAYDLFIGVPVHRTPEVVVASGLTEGGTDGWVAVDKQHMTTSHPGVYALGDCADAPVPRAGVFAVSAARIVADHILSTISGSGGPEAWDGSGVCYIEFGGDLVGRVEANFLGGAAPVAPLVGPTEAISTEKRDWAEDLLRRWFG